MPRKYRPPAARRRKAKKRAAAPAPLVADAFEETAGAEALDLDEELLEEPLAAEPAAPRSEAHVVTDTGPRHTRHINRDYSYVRNEMLRIAAIAAFLLVAIALTAVFR